MDHNNNNQDDDHQSLSASLPYSPQNSSTTTTLESVRANNATMVQLTAPFLESPNIDSSNPLGEYGHDHNFLDDNYGLYNPTSPYYYVPNYDYDPLRYSDEILEISTHGNMKLPHHYNLFNFDNQLSSTSDAGQIIRDYATIGTSSTSAYNYNSTTQYDRSFEQVKGKLWYFARCKDGCDFLRKRLREGSPEEVHMIFSEAKENFCSLILHRIGSTFVQKLIDLVNDNQLLEILVVLIKDGRRLRHICSDDIGTRVMQKLVPRLRMLQLQFLLIRAMIPITRLMTKNNNCNHVIKQCLQYFDAGIVEPLLVEIERNFLEIATDKYGCCILQYSILKAKESLFRAKSEAFLRLVSNIIVHVLSLSENSYGNYVVQYVIELKLTVVNELIVNQLQGSFVALSKNKQGSNVVEKLLLWSKPDYANRITFEIFTSPDAPEILLHEFGNFVTQTALEASTGSARFALANLIDKFSAQLQSHPYGNKVLARKRLLYNNQRRTTNLPFGIN